MRLLIITQKVDKDDPILGFFHRWIEEFSKNCESVLVICLQKGVYDLPNNVRVFSLGKEDGVSRIKYLYRFYKYIFSSRDQYDSVFVHMNPIYIVLGGLVWRIMRKRIALWYTHKKVNFVLRIAERLVDTVFSASNESFRLKSKKLVVTGHGIDTKLFYPRERAESGEKTIVTSGRISRTKNIHLMIEAVSKVTLPDIKLIVVGEPQGSEEIEYKKELDALINKLGVADRVFFAGRKSQEELAEILGSTNLFLNLSNTGSLDKAVLEAVASGVPTLTSNEAFKLILPKSFFIFTDIKSFSLDVETSLNSSDREMIYTQYIIQNHNLDNLIPLILSKFSNNNLR